VSGGPVPCASRGEGGDVPFCECVAAGVLCSLVVVGILSGMSVVCLRIGLTGPRWGRGLLGGTALGVDVTLSSWRIVGLVAECVRCGCELALAGGVVVLKNNVCSSKNNTDL